jgi:hypothetical protein
MLNLVLYSDQIIPANEKIDWALVALMEGRGCRIGYILQGPTWCCVLFAETSLLRALRAHAGNLLRSRL